LPSRRLLLAAAFNHAAVVENEVRLIIGGMASCASETEAEMALGLIASASEFRKPDAILIQATLPA